MPRAIGCLYRSRTMAILVFLATFLFFQATTASISRGLLDETWSLIEDGDIEPFSLVLRNEILDQAGANRKSSLYALGATLTAVSELSWVRPGSSCAYANLINANLDLASGHASSSSVGAAIDGYAVALAQAVENIRILGQCCVLPSPWPYLDNCCGDYGRQYPFEASWDLVSGCNSKSIRCAARDLYTAMTARSNNVGAAATSAATEPALAMIESIEGDLVKYLSTAVDTTCCDTKKKTLRTMAGSLKSAIFRAASSVRKSFSSKCH